MNSRCFRLFVVIFVLLVGCTPESKSEDTAEQPEAPVSMAPPETPAPRERADCPAALASALPAEFARDARVKAERLIVVFKHAELIGAYEHDTLVSGLCAPIVMGDWPYEAKVREDFMSTPEGWYYVAAKRTSKSGDPYPYTAFGLALQMSYPNAEDVERALAQKVITPAVAAELRRAINRGKLPRQNTAMGGDILLHSWSTGRRPDTEGEVTFGANTAGCVGIDDEPMQRLFDWAHTGDSILSLPWRYVLQENGAIGEAEIPTGPPPNTFSVEDVERLTDPTATAARGQTTFYITSIVGNTSP